jgi:hypothetical protein
LIVAVWERIPINFHQLQSTVSKGSLQKTAEILQQHRLSKSHRKLQLGLLDDLPSPNPWVKRKVRT